MFGFLGSKRSQRWFFFLIIIFFLILFIINFYYYYFPVNNSLYGKEEQGENIWTPSPCCCRRRDAARKGVGSGAGTPAQVMFMAQKSPNIPAYNGHTVNTSFPIMKDVKLVSFGWKQNILHGNRSASGQKMHTAAVMFLIIFPLCS